jgi:hypothetical protein
MSNAPVLSPKNIFVDAAHIPSWLIAQMRPRLQTLSPDIRFVVVSEKSVGQIRASYGEALSSRDVIIQLQSAHQYSSNLAGPETEAVEKLAAKYETEFDVLYWRDISNQDRRYNYIFNTWPDTMPRHPQNMDISSLQLKQCINEYFSIVSELVADYQIDLVLARPDRMLGAVVVQIADRRMIPHSFCMTALHRGLATWVFGSYRGDGMLRAELQSLPSNRSEYPPVGTQDIPRYGSAAFSSFNRSAKAMELFAELKTFLLDRLLLGLAALARGGKPAGTHYRRSLFQIINRFRAIRFFEQHALSLNQIKEIEGKFVIFLLPLDPEYNTHSQARHFWHLEAIVRQVVLCLPAGYRLLLKEHAVSLGNRSPEWYCKLAALPNVSWVRFQESGVGIAKLSSAVISCAGTIALEASLIPRKCIVFARDYIFNFMPNVIYAPSMATLDVTLRSALEPFSDEQSVETVNLGRRVYRAIENLGFEATDTTIVNGPKAGLDESSLDKCVEVLLKCYRMQLGRGAQIEEKELQCTSLHNAT